MQVDSLSLRIATAEASAASLEAQHASDTDWLRELSAKTEDLQGYCDDLSESLRFSENQGASAEAEAQSERLAKEEALKAKQSYKAQLEEVRALSSLLYWRQRVFSSATRCVSI